LESYKVIRDDFEKQVDDLIDKYQKSKLKFDILKDEEVRGKMALKSFDKHVELIEKDRDTGKLTQEEASQVLGDLCEDTIQMDRVKIKVAYNVPQDTMFG